MSEFTDKDLQQMTEQGTDRGQVLAQLERFRTGFPSLKIVAAAIVDDGILKLSDSQVDRYASTYERSDVFVIKFVPASGAASRMFKQLFAFVDAYEGTIESYDDFVSKNPAVAHFFEHLEQFAFYSELSEKYTSEYGYGLGEARQKREFGKIADLLLSAKGLSYGTLPKGLLAFHAYPQEVRTPAHEHVAEGLAYAKKAGRTAIHFTVSPEHHKLFVEHLDHVKKTQYPEEEILVSFSTQRPSTDTVAATPDFKPFRTDDGALLFRPAGHGALLENLNQLDADLIFIKNIDNVVPDRIKDQTVRYKQVLAGVLLDKQQQVFNLLERQEAGEDISEEGTKLLETMGCKGFEKSEIANLLNRPIRVCGMVKNEGEPGGGPFWVEDGNQQTLQIVESAQVNTADPDQMETFKTGTHFNPVDIVFGRKDYRGEPFDLLAYRDENTGFISEKSAAGQKLLAMELPGLWNGSMSDWNTIFVEVPIITFNPVKEVTDLLKENHQPM